MKTQNETAKEIRAYLKGCDEKYVFKKCNMRLGGKTAWAIFDGFGNRVSSMDTLGGIRDRVQNEGMRAIFN